MPAFSATVLLVHGIRVWWEYENIGFDVYLLRIEDQSFIGLAWDSVFGWKIDLLGFRLTDYDYGEIEYENDK